MIMIRKILFVLPIIAAIFTTSCKDDEVLKVFSISPQKITFNYKGDSSYLSVYGDKENWEIWIGEQDPAKTWCSFDKEGTVFTKSGQGKTEAMLIFSKANLTREKFTDTLYLRDKGGKYGDIKVALTLSPIDIMFNVKDSVIYVPVNGEVEVKVESNVDSYEIAEQPEEMTSERTEDGFTFNFGENNYFLKTYTVKIVGKWKEGKTKDLIMTFIQDAQYTGVNSGIRWDSTQLVQIKDKQPTIKWDLSTPVSTWEGIETSKVTTSEGTVERVIAVNLQNKSLSGSLPTQFRMLPYLKVLRLDNNSFDGEFIYDYRLLPYLNTLRLDNNQITGTLKDDTFAFWSDMRDFSISGNKFSGVIPKEISNMKKIEKLQLSSNDFTGTLPAEIGNFRQMTIFTVNDNQLTGVVPMSYQNSINWFKWESAKNILPQKNGVTLTLK